MTKKYEITLSTVGLTSHLVGGKQIDEKEGNPIEFDEHIWKLEFDALKCKNSTFLLRRNNDMNFSFQSQLLLGVDPLKWSVRLKVLIENFQSHEISLRVPCEEDWCRSFFSWCLMSNMVIFPKGFVQIDDREEQFFAMCPGFVKRGYQDLIKTAQQERIDITYVRPESAKINEMTAKLFMQRLLVKLGYRLNFFADEEALNERSLIRQKKLENLLFNWRLISKISIARNLKEEIEFALVKLEK